MQKCTAVTKLPQVKRLLLQKTTQNLSREKSYAKDEDNMLSSALIVVHARFA
jgi:hypothetical protein